MFEFRLKFHWGLFLRFQLTIFQHWFRYWLGAIQTTSHYLKQWWLVYWHIYASLGLNALIPMWQLEHSVYFSFMNILKLRIKNAGLFYDLQYIPRNMHTVFALLCFVVVIHWLIFPYPSGLLHWHCGNLTIAPVPAKQPWWIWINTSCEFIMNDCITTTKQSTTKPCAYFLGYTVFYTTWCVCYDCLSFLAIFLNCQEQQGTSYTSRKSKFLFKKYIVIYGLTYVT